MISWQGSHRPERLREAAGLNGASTMTASNKGVEAISAAADGFDPLNGKPDGAARYLIGRERWLIASRIVLRIGPDLLILLEGRNGRTLLTFGPFPEDDVVAIWRGLGNASGLPLAIEAPGGKIEAPSPGTGRERPGRLHDRRHLVILTGRRPRFLARRKPGRWPGRPIVHREREIAAGRGG